MFDFRYFLASVVLISNIKWISAPKIENIDKNNFAIVNDESNREMATKRIFEGDIILRDRAGPSRSQNVPTVRFNFWINFPNRKNGLLSHLRVLWP